MDDPYQIYYNMLDKWSQKMNLMSVSGYDEFFEKHVLDSKRAIAHLEGMKSVLDLGSGAGFPGLPVKIEMPAVEVVLLEATRKKVSFCEEVVRKLGLKGITVVWGRAEDEGIMKGLGAFDATISRATWDLDKYLRISAHYLAEGNLCVAMKGSRWRDELKKANKIIEEKFSLIKTEEYELSGSEKRAILVFKKR